MLMLFTLLAGETQGLQISDPADAKDSIQLWQLGHIFACSVQLVSLDGGT